MAVSPDLPLQQRGEALAAGLPPLLIAAERVASTVAQGVHGRRRVGQGETFWQFRPYELGDTPQTIDWRQTAKSDRVFVRQTEWEAAQSVWLWRDTSPSMDWSSDRALETKRARADLLLLGLAVLAIQAGERVSLAGTGRRPDASRATLTRLALELERGSESVLLADEDALAPRQDLPRFGQVVWFGDFLQPLEIIEARVRYFAERGLRGHILQILDPAEEGLPFRGRVRFEGLEGEDPWLLSRVETVRGAYLERLTQQRDGLVEIARQAGWTAGLHHTDSTPQSALLGLYQALAVQTGRR
ncbi:DUF58 domain-containing protein [Algihabitans sp.]|uniref:DUF58 domain-containing protein n=1 Tax=Algihabitans sp. TaxID=2821514 RepID=UPI003BAC333D